MQRALVIRTYGDQELAKSMAAAMESYRRNGGNRKGSVYRSKK